MLSAPKALLWWPEHTDTALIRPATHVFDMTGRPIHGWILVDSPVLTEDDALGRWVDEGHGFAPSLAPK